MISTFANGKEGIDRKNYTLNALKLENKNVVVNRYYNGDLYFKSKQVDEEGYQKVLRIFNSGQIFSGSSNFQYDIKKGVVYFQNGNIFLGSDQISSDNIDGEGIFITLNSDGTFNTYMGEFVDGKINGFGTVTYANGKVNDGLFENGNFIKSNDQIAQEKLQLIELEKKKEQEKIDKQEIYKRETGIAWEEAKRLYEIERQEKLKYCGWCGIKLGSRKYSSNHSQEYKGNLYHQYCSSHLIDFNNDSWKWEPEYFCSEKCGVEKCWSKIH
jgi:hypothetical protein